MLDIETYSEVPKEYQRLTITQAYEIMGMPRATFNRNHRNPKTAKPENLLSVQTDEYGKKYIDFSEFKRVFGNEVYTKLNIYMRQSQLGKNTHAETAGETSNSPVETVAYRDLLKLQFDLKEAHKDLEREKQRTVELETRYRLLEDKSKDSEEAKTALKQALDTEKSRLQELMERIANEKAEHQKQIEAKELEKSLAQAELEQIFAEQKAFNNLPFWKKMFKSFNPSSKGVNTGMQESRNSLENKKW